MRLSNKVVHGLWIGDGLGDIEIMCLKSFLYHGHDFHLWSYQNLKIPTGVILEDASDIVPRTEVWKYPDDADLDVASGKGSYAGFSDIFRYKLLYKLGGWWSDMDVTCLRPLDPESPYWFRNHWKLLMVGNLMKVPPKSELMHICRERALKEVTKDNTKWHKPIEILCDTIQKLGLDKYIRYGVGNLDSHRELAMYHKERYALPQAWQYVHWLNSVGVKDYVPGSALHQLLKQYGLVAIPHI